MRNFKKLLAVVLAVLFVVPSMMFTSTATENKDVGTNWQADGSVALTLTESGGVEVAADTDAAGPNIIEVTFADNLTTVIDGFNFDLLPRAGYDGKYADQYGVYITDRQSAFDGTSHLAGAQTFVPVWNSSVEGQNNEKVMNISFERGTGANADKIVKFVTDVASNWYWQGHYSGGAANTYELETPIDLGDWINVSISCGYDALEEANVCAVTVNGETFNLDGDYYTVPTSAGATLVPIFYACASTSDYSATGGFVIDDIIADESIEYFDQNDPDAVRVEPTCLVAGTVSAPSSFDPTDIRVVENLPATGHNFGAWTNTTPATCTTEGEDTRVCVNCNGQEDGGVETRPVDKLPHNYGAWVVTQEGDCSSDHIEQRVCADCQHVDEKVTVGAHKYVPQYFHDGKLVSECSVCGDVTFGTVTPVYDEGTKLGYFTNDIVGNATGTYWYSAGSNNIVAMNAGFAPFQDVYQAITDDSLGGIVRVQDIGTFYGGNYNNQAAARLISVFGDKLHGFSAEVETIKGVQDAYPLPSSVSFLWTNDFDAYSGSAPCVADESNVFAIGSHAASEKSLVVSLVDVNYVNRYTKLYITSIVNGVASTTDYDVEYLAYENDDWTDGAKFEVGLTNTDSVFAVTINGDEYALPALAGVFGDGDYNFAVQAESNWNAAANGNYQAFSTNFTINSINGDATPYDWTGSVVDDPDGHLYGDWTVTSAGDCVTDGSKERVCAICGDVDTATIPGTGHAYEYYTHAGNLVGVCPNCGDTTVTAIAAGEGTLTDDGDNYDGYTGNVTTHENGYWTTSAFNLVGDDLGIGSGYNHFHVTGIDNGDLKMLDEAAFFNDQPAASRAQSAAVSKIAAPVGDFTTVVTPLEANGADNGFNKFAQNISVLFTNKPDQYRTAKEGQALEGFLRAADTHPADEVSLEVVLTNGLDASAKLTQFMIVSYVTGGVAYTGTNGVISQVAVPINAAITIGVDTTNGLVVSINGTDYDLSSTGAAGLLDSGDFYLGYQASNSWNASQFRIGAARFLINSINDVEETAYWGSDLNPTGHLWVSKGLVSVPKPGAAGREVFECSLCGETKLEETEYVGTITDTDGSDNYTTGGANVLVNEDSYWSASGYNMVGTDLGIGTGYNHYFVSGHTDGGDIKILDEAQFFNDQPAASRAQSAIVSKYTTDITGGFTTTIVPLECNGADNGFTKFAQNYSVLFTNHPELYRTAKEGQGFEGFIRSADGVTHPADEVSFEIVFWNGNLQNNVNYLFVPSVVNGVVDAAINSMTALAAPVDLTSPITIAVDPATFTVTVNGTDYTGLGGTAAATAAASGEDFYLGYQASNSFNASQYRIMSARFSVDSINDCTETAFYMGSDAPVVYETTYVVNGLKSEYKKGETINTGDITISKVANGVTYETLPTTNKPKVSSIGRNKSRTLTCADGTEVEVTYDVYELGLDLSNLDNSGNTFKRTYNVGETFLSAGAGSSQGNLGPKTGAYAYKKYAADDIDVSASGARHNSKGSFDYYLDGTQIFNEETVFTVADLGEHTLTLKSNKAAWLGAEASITLTVARVLNGITVTAPTKLEYVHGEALDLTDMVVTANYEDADVVLADGYTVTGYDPTIDGTQTVTVTFEGATDTFEVVVKNPLEITLPKATSGETDDEIVVSRFLLTGDHDFTQYFGAGQLQEYKATTTDWYIYVENRIENEDYSVIAPAAGTYTIATRYKDDHVECSTVTVELNTDCEVKVKANDTMTVYVEPTNDVTLVRYALGEGITDYKQIKNGTNAGFFRAGTEKTLEVPGTYSYVIVLSNNNYVFGEFTVANNEPDPASYVVKGMSFSLADYTGVYVARFALDNDGELTTYRAIKDATGGNGYVSEARPIVILKQPGTYSFVIMYGDMKTVEFGTFTVPQGTDVDDEVGLNANVDNANLTDNIALNSGINVSDDVNIVGNGNTISAAPGATGDSVIRIDNKDGAVISGSDLVIDGRDAGLMGLSLNSDLASIVALNDVDIYSNTIALNLEQGSNGLDATIEDCSIDAAVIAKAQSFGSLAVNNTECTSRIGTDGDTAILVDAGVGTGETFDVTVKNSTLNLIVPDGVTEFYIVKIMSPGTVTLKNVTFMINGVEIPRSEYRNYVYVDDAVVANTALTILD